ncbi:alkaline phosphatase [Sphingomonas flavalba]|uniref:alkaline phosphatase n=1 Tax=Sphingomonas flavalba TaxID=2559804 RepID=UPI0039E016EB
MILATTSRILAMSLLLLASSGCARATTPASSVTASPAPRAPAKNVILFIGDGMSIATVTAARIYDGQSRGETGEENLLSFEHFPSTALVKTYNSDQQVPDSAGTATAMNTGVKTRAGVIGIGPSAYRGDCTESRGAILPNLAGLAHARGKSVGFVSTMRLTHATPAAVYAHVADRNWESDADIPVVERAKGCPDIAAQMLAFPFDVALGGGEARFRVKGQGGRRLTTDADILAQWQGRTGGTLVRTRAELAGVGAAKGPLLGLFAGSHLQYMLERKPDTTEPTLSEMTVAAIAKAAQNSNGYFLMIEGGNIDHGHHEGRANIALSETQELSRAVQLAIDTVDLSETMILVTADHSHVFTIGGYPSRGNPILGLVKGNDHRGDPLDTPTLAADGQPYTTLGYYNGPGAVSATPRPAPELGPDARQQALVPTGSFFSTSSSLSESHGGDDVALYATGPGAEQVRGVIEQSRIFNIIEQAFGWR